MKKWSCMLFILCLLMGVIPPVQANADFDADSFAGMVLTVADSSYSVEMYKGITSNKTLMTPIYTEGNAYYYEVSSGAYCYFVKPASGTARYSVRKNFYVTADMAKTKTVWDITPTERTKEGWDPKEVWSYSDEIMENAFPSSPELWPDYADLLTVPALTNPRTPHQMTTQTEMMDYIAGLDKKNDSMYVYGLGKSGGTADKQLDIPVVFFTGTDLSEASTWEEAAKLLRENGKLTVLYQAQVHGNEPAAGEAALAMLKALKSSYGDNLLDNMNICVLPRLNVYGASEASRYVYVNGKDVDPNRDYVKLDSQEVLLRTQLFLELEPEVFFDNHEYQLRVTNTNVAMHDVKLNSVYTVKSTDAFRELSLTLAYEAFNRAEENGLGYGWYDDCTNGYNASVGTTNVAMRGCLSFLTETNGIYGGNQQLERRMMSHISVVTGILDYVNANTAAVQKVVDDQRRDIVERGKTYEDSDVIVLKSGSTDHPELYINGKQVSSSGKITDTTFTAKAFDVATRSRTAPTAYVIPAGAAWAEMVVENLTHNGVTCTRIPAGSVVQLQQYTGSDTEVALTDETFVSFPEGAYVMTMAQENSYILAVRMEPDMSDGSSNTVTFVQEGVISAENGKFPIYRYIRDLNSNAFVDYAVAAPAPTGLTAEGATIIGGTGKITGLDATKSYEYRAADAEKYTAVAAGATEIADLSVGNYMVRYAAVGTDLPSADAKITVGYALSKYVVYVDSESGSSTNDAYTPDTAASTYSIAKGQLDLIMEYAPAGTTGEIHLIGTYQMTKSSTGYLSLQKHDYPLLITGGMLIFKDSANSQKFLRMGGDTTFDNITLQVGSDSNAYYLCGEGHKLTIGKNVTTLAYNNSWYFNIMGGVGEYSNNYYAAQTDVTVMSGTWRYVFAGGYVSSVSKDAKLKASNCSVTRIGGSHNGKLEGNLYIELDNINVSDDAIYCGNQQKNNVAGNVTMVLGEGIGAKKVYAGSNSAGNVGGTVTIVANGIDLPKTAVYGKPNNTTGTVGGLKLVLKQGQLSNVASSFVTRDGVDIQLGSDQTEMATLNYSCNLDLNGCNGNIKVTDGKNVTVWDSATDDYKVQDAQGYGVLSATGTVVAKEGYNVRTEANGKSYHRWEFALSNITLRPNSAGVYYVGHFGLNELYQSDVESYGVVLSLNADPALDKSDCLASTMTEWPSGGKGNGTVLQNIMKAENSDSVNKRNANKSIYGVAYIKYKDGTVEYSNEARFTLKYMVEYADSVWEDLTQAQQDSLVRMYGRFPAVMDSWNISNIRASKQ